MKIDFSCAVLHIDIVFCVWYALVTKRKTKSKRRNENVYQTVINTSGKRGKRTQFKNRDTVYYVMDKRNKKAVCHSLPMAVRDKILRGYFFTCRYINGEKRA